MPEALLCGLDKRRVLHAAIGGRGGGSRRSCGAVIGERYTKGQERQSGECRPAILHEYPENRKIRLDKSTPALDFKQGV